MYITINKFIKSRCYKIYFRKCKSIIVYR